MGRADELLHRPVGVRFFRVFLFFTASLFNLSNCSSVSVCHAWTPAFMYTLKSSTTFWRHCVKDNTADRVSTVFLQPASFKTGRAPKAEH